jgi:hypothetical protein
MAVTEVLGSALGTTATAATGEATGTADVNALKAMVAKMERVAKEGIIDEG